MISPFLDGTVVDHFYDDLGRPARTDWTVGGKLFSVEQTYDPLGRPDELRYPQVKGRVESKFTVIGDEYSEEGQVTAYRLLLIETGHVAAVKQSFLWN